MKFVAVVKLYVFHTVESPQEVEMPVAAAELAVGDGVQSVGFLLFYQVGDKPVFNRAQLFVRDFSIGKLCPCRFKLCRTQEAAHDIGTKWSM